MNSSPRKLAKGFSWQPYAVVAVKPVSAKAHKEDYQSNRWNMEFAHDHWVDEMKAYINIRANELGMSETRIVAQIVEEPNESKSVEMIYWNKHNCIFVWSIWAYMNGPVPERMVNETALPLLNFWPSDLTFEKDQCEVFDAASLTRREQTGIIW